MFKKIEFNPAGPQPMGMKAKRTGCARILLLGFLALLGVGLAALGLAAWDNTRLPVHSEIADRLSDEEKARIIEAQHLRQTVGDQVLPGWGQAEIPIIVYNEAYAFLIGVSSAPTDGWGTVHLDQQLGAAWDVVPGDTIQGKPYYRQALAEGVTPQSFTVTVGDGYAASLTTFEYTPIVMRQEIQADLPGFLMPVFPYRIATDLLVSSSDQYISLMLHEAAHAYQGLIAPERLAAGEQANDEGEALYPWDDENLRQDWKSELLALKLALQADSDEERRILAREFLLIRGYRRQEAGLSLEMIDFERQREWVEGIGRYAELSVYRLAQAETGYLPATEIANDPDFDEYRGYDRRWNRELDQLGRMASDASERRFYYTGMAQAVLLDYLDPGWQSELFEPGVWLEDLLAQALEMDSITG